jgi:hypothetical protein
MRAIGARGAHPSATFGALKLLEPDHLFFSTLILKALLLLNT